MRRRSGALHCQSQQDFIQLASAAHNHMGIFYDQKTNKRIMNQFKINQQPNKSTAILTISNPEHYADDQKQSYSGFQFGLESQAHRQERQELQRINAEIKEKRIICIISEQVSPILQKISKQPYLDTFDTSCCLGLAVKKVGKKITRYWVMNKAQLKKQNQLLNVYLQNSEIIIEEGQRWQIIKNNTGQYSQQILEEWRSILE